MTTNTDSLLSDFGRSTDRHLESARLKIAPKPQAPQIPSGTVPPVLEMTAEMEKPKGGE
jgi:hypothetical protein